MLEWIMAFVQLCREAIAAGRAVQSWSESALSLREKELLRSAADDGLFLLSQSDLYGRFVATSTKQFVGHDSAVTAHYLDAFMRLCHRGLVIDQSERTFRLTGQGYDLARGLKS